MEEPPAKHKLALGRRVRMRLATVAQLFSTISRGPFWWLTPFCIVLAIFAILLLLLNVVPGAAPFVYALF